MVVSAVHNLTINSLNENWGRWSPKLFRKRDQQKRSKEHPRVGAGNPMGYPEEWNREGDLQSLSKEGNPKERNRERESKSWSREGSQSWSRKWYKQEWNGD